MNKVTFNTIDKYSSFLFSNDSIIHHSDYEYQLFVTAQIIQKNIQETKQLLSQNGYKGKQLNKLISEIQNADPYQDKRMMSTIAQWLINNDIQSPNEHTEDIKEFASLRKQVKDYRFNITNQEIANNQKELLSFNPINKYYGEIQQQNIKMKQFLGIEQGTISDEGLPLVGELVIDEKTSFKMYQVNDENQLEHPLLKRMTYCVMSYHYGEYGGPPYYPIFKWTNGIPEQFSIIIPNYIEEDITQAVRNQNNTDRLSSKDIILISPLIKKVLPLEQFSDSKFVNNLYNLENNKDPQVSSFDEAILYFEDKNSINIFSVDWVGWKYLSNAKNNNQAWDVINKCKDYPQVFKNNTFKLIVNSAYLALNYAFNVLRGPFKEGEEVISKIADKSYLYALDILKGPFPLGEKAIALDAEYSYYYAQNVLKDRFLLGESAIAQNAHYSFLYARFILEDRFLLGEKNSDLLQDVDYIDFIKSIGKFDELISDYPHLFQSQSNEASYASLLFNNDNKIQPTTNMIMASKESNILLKAQQRAYFSPYGPGYASPYSDSTTEISSMGPIRNPDSDHSHNEPRGWLYKSIESDFINEWGGDQGQKPNGMVKIKVEKICKKCKGKGCSKCHYKGKIEDFTLKPKNSPKVDGRIRDQLRYKTEEEGGPYGSHNRDFNNLREEPQTWDQMMSDKMMLGKPSIY